MAYVKENFLPFITDKIMKIPYNNEIKGFIQVQEKTENDFFSSVSKSRFNGSIKDINFQIQRLYCDKLKTQNETNFVSMNFGLKIAILVMAAVYFIIFFLLEAHTTASEDFVNNAFIAPVIVCVVVCAVFVVFLILMVMQSKKVINFDKEMINIVKRGIKKEEHWYRAQGYRWAYNKKLEVLTIEKDF